jgi:hypothetical protein
VPQEFLWSSPDVHGWFGELKLIRVDDELKLQQEQAGVTYTFTLNYEQAHDLGEILLAQKGQT